MKKILQFKLKILAGLILKKYQPEIKLMAQNLAKLIEKIYLGKVAKIRFLLKNT